MKHLEILNYLINKNNYKSYLEIGVYNGINFSNVKCENKECCDPCICNVQIRCNITYKMTSDEMFKQMPIDKKYDIIFIDGMHDESYVDRDIMNSLKHLNANGIICLHDTVPPTKKSAIKYDTYNDNRGVWCGDVFKSIIKLYNTNLEYYTVNNGDYGLTIIKHHDDFNINLSDIKCEYEYEDIFFTNQGMKLLNMISVEEFKQKF